MSNNSSATMLHLWRPVLFASQSIMGLITNIFVVVVIVRSKKLSKLEFSKFLINQSLIDATSCVMLMFSYFSLSHFDLELRLTQGDFFDELICRVWVNDLLLWGFLVSSTYHIVMVSIQKYGQIVHPVRHRKCFGGRVSWLTLGLPWIFGPTYSLVTLSGKARIREDNVCEVNVWATPMTGRVIGTAIVCIQFLIPMTIIFLCYAQILTTIRRRWRPVCSKHNNTTTTTISATTTLKKQPKNKLVRGLKIQKNIIKTLTLICVCFFLCWVTNTVIFFAINIGWARPEIYNSWIFQFSVIAVFTNSVINPFIYMIEFQPFRKVMLGMVKGRPRELRANSSVVSFNSADIL